MNADRLTLLALADTMLASNGSVEQLIAASERVFDQALPWAPLVCAALAERTGAHFHDFNRHELAAILAQLLGRPVDSADDDENEDEAENEEGGEDGPAGPAYVVLPPVRRYCTALPLRAPAPPWLAALGLPALPSVGALALWLDEPVGALAWLADRWRVPGQASGPLQHYHYRWLPKRSGGLRLLEIPKGRLLRVQHAILRGILDRVPPHPAAHGFTRNRSCLSHASLHTGQALVLRMDLKDFFTSVRHARVHALFEKLGYSSSVAGLLARLCVNRTPHAAVAALPWAERQPWQSAHLPQGSPCSPALANLCAYRLDLRLSALAASMGATYSRYADDLAFSGGAGFARAAQRFAVRVAAIALEEGFAINHRKTRAMGQGSRQQLTGVVVNRHANLARADYDKLKAILTNCARHGAPSQNHAGHADFRAHLQGRVAHAAMLNPRRASKLQQLFNTIVF